GRLLGAILVERGFVSGPALAVALAEQYGVELATERGFGTGLWAEIDRRHRAGRGHEPRPDNVVRLEHAPKPQPRVEAVPDPAPDPELERLEAENRRLQEELELLRAELTRPKLVEAPEPEPASAHLLFVPSPARYALVERDGPPPPEGSEVELEERLFVVSKVGPAPFPGETLACAFLLPRA
ncbi:MAG TPA: hypothetical protein VLD16_06430, partial [Gaiellaceae bacterium]|nr:hypothetical protein [Gaiellaceae bacterium]